MSNMRIGTRLGGGFLLVTAIMIVVGAIAYFGMTNMSAKTTNIMETSPLVGAAMEVKFSMKGEQLMVMEMLAAENKEDLGEVWKEHQALATDVKTYSGAILNGADTENGRIYPAKDEALRSIVRTFSDNYEKEFKPRLATINEIMQEDYKLQREMGEAMDRFEEDYDHIIELAEQFEGAVKERIDLRLAGGASASSIMNTENTWADMAMEMKTTISQSRIAIEEYAQGEVAALPEIEQEFNKTVEEFDTWITALLEGATTDEGRIVKVTVPQLRALAEELDKTHNDRFQKSAADLMEAQKQLVVMRERAGELDHAADKASVRMIENVSRIEGAAKAAVGQAARESQEVASSATTFVLIAAAVGIILAILLGVIITMGITRPLSHAVEAADHLAEGDLRYSIQKGGMDETGRMLNSMHAMMEKLREVVGSVTSASENVAAGSEELNATADSLSQGSTEQAASVEEISSSVEEMASNIRQNADNAQQTEKIALKAAKDAEEGGGRDSDRGRHEADRGEDCHHRGDRPPDQFVGPQRGHRGGAGRGARQRLCRSGGRGAQTGRA